jgi:hypothetical protein
MAIRLPLRSIFTYSDSGTSSVATGTIQTFTIPQDTDNVVLKLTASITGGGMSAFLQTTDDGGTTWYDVARTSVVSDATGATAQWLTAPTINTATAIGPATASTLASRTASGLPLLSQQARVVLSYATAGTANTIATVQVLVNNQSATA